MRALKIAGAAVAALILVAVLLLVIGIPSGFMTSAIQTRVERATGYRLTVAGATRIGIWPSLNVILNDLTLQEPGDRDGRHRLTVGRVRAEMTLASLWAGRPQITELAITAPTLYVPLLRERSPEPAPSPKPVAPNPTEADAIAVYRITVTDGTVVFANLRDRVETRISAIAADTSIGGDRHIAISGSARAAEHPLAFTIKATAPALPLARQTIPVELTLDTSGLLQGPLSAKAAVRLNGATVMINGLAGTLGDGPFNGWASVDLASKPLVKLDLDFQQLDLAVPKAPAASASPDSQPPSQPPSQLWSNATIDVNGLNYVDVQARVSAASLNIGEAHFAPAAIDAALNGGVFKANFANLGLYDGQASGELTVDASAGTPTYALRSDLTSVRALPLLRSAAGFDRLDGKLQAKLAVRSSGTSQRAIMANLGGTVFAVLQDGALRGLNVARMIRSLTSGTLSGWQDDREQTTDLTQLGASFRIDKGQATTADLTLVGPLVKMTGAGTVDLAAQSLALRVEPKLVMTTEGQGRATDPVGLGIPVAIEGPWAAPNIYPDVAGILDNPDAAYARLKELGQGLFGGGSGGGSDPLGGQLGETLGNLLQQGLSQGRRTPPPASSAPAPGIPPPSQDSQPMNDVLRQLFNR